MKYKNFNLLDQVNNRDINKYHKILYKDNKGNTLFIPKNLFENTFYISVYEIDFAGTLVSTIGAVGRIYKDILVFSTPDHKDILHIWEWLTCAWYDYSTVINCNVAIMILKLKDYYDYN